MSALKQMAGLSMGRLAILAILTSVAYFFTYFDSGASLNAQISAADAQMQAEANRRKDIEKFMKKEEEMRGNLLQLQRNLEVVKSKIPNEFKDTQMSVILNSASGISGVSLLELSTQPTARVAPAALNSESIKPEDLIEEVKFNIVLAGNYDSFLKFLDVLTKEDKILKFRNFIIEKNSADIDDDSIKFKGEVIGYKQSGILANSVQEVK